jgi:hypothetical protein
LRLRRDLRRRRCQEVCGFQPFDRHRGTLLRLLSALRPRESSEAGNKVASATRLPGSGRTFAINAHYPYGLTGWRVV